MESIRQSARSIIANRYFEFAIAIIILINSVLIGVETYVTSGAITCFQSFALMVFTLEIIIRFVASRSVWDFFRNGWNLFDLTLVLIGYIPEDLFANGSTLMALRVIRVFRVLRLLRASKEIMIIVNVLLSSLSALFYNAVLLFIFIYLFSIIGVSMFRLPDPESLTPAELAIYEEYVEMVHEGGSRGFHDPFGSLEEATFTLFRELTGDGWTELRYDEITAHEFGLIKVSPMIITSYHVLWFMLSAFLLMNLVVGAVVNNYELAMSEQNRKRLKEKQKTVSNQ